MLKLLILNPHFIPFLILFFVGAFFLLAAPMKYRVRTKTKKIALLPWDIAKYNKQEKYYLLIGLLLVFVGIVGFSEVEKRHGYKRTYTDKDGNVSIEKVYTNPYNPNLLNTDSTGNIKE